MILTPPKLYATNAKKISQCLSKPIPCHRLDARVSGLILVAKTSFAVEHINAQFRERSTKKKYRAILAGGIVTNCTDENSFFPTYTCLDTNENGARLLVVPAIENCSSKNAQKSLHKVHSHVDYLEKKSHNGTIFYRLSKKFKSGEDVIIIRYPVQGRDSTSILKIKSTTPSNAYGKFTHVSLFPVSGRKHQLRKHCALLGCPILGDDLYHESSFYSEKYRRVKIDSITSNNYEMCDLDSSQLLRTHSPVRKNVGLLLMSTTIEFNLPDSGDKDSCNLRMLVRVNESNKFQRILSKAKKPISE